MPLIVKDGPVVPEASSQEALARELFNLIARTFFQGRPHLQWDERLSEVARKRCRDQAIRGWSGHIDPQGKGPNLWVVEAGYMLPEYYSKARDGNNVESVAHAGRGVPKEVLHSWLESPVHRPHVMGENQFYRRQTNIGVGYAYVKNSKYGHYWSFISAPPEDIESDYD